MQATLILPKKTKSSFARYNFKTFPIVEVFSEWIALNIGIATVDFTFDEVAIYDIENVVNELKRRESENKLSDSEITLRNLESYCTHKNIKI